MSTSSSKTISPSPLPISEIEGQARKLALSEYQRGYNDRMAFVVQALAKQDAYAAKRKAHQQAFFAEEQRRLHMPADETGYGELQQAITDCALST